MNKLHGIFLGSLFVFLALPGFSKAASLYIDPAESTLNRGDSVTLSVRLNVDQAKRECVNAVDGVISYTDNIDPVDVSIGDSILSVWVEEPRVDREKKQITFAGGLPNGYCGRVVGDPRLTNTLLEIVLRSPGFIIGTKNDSLLAEINFLPETTAYLNDGLGTKAELSLYGSKITLDSSPGKFITDDWQDRVKADNVSPEEFSIFLNKGKDNTFSEKYYIVFNTKDKQTGIDHYEVIEEPLTTNNPFSWGQADAPWIKARSPYVLKDQSLNSTIRVKAMDKAGNEYIATLVPDESLRSSAITAKFFFYLLLSISALLLLVVVILTLLFHRRKKSAVLPEETNGSGLESNQNDKL